MKNETTGAVPVPNNVVEFTGAYCSPPHVSEGSLAGCDNCGEGFTFILRTSGEIACSSCGHTMTAASWSDSEEVV